MNKLIIIGAGGHGKVCADIAEKSGKYNEICFLDDGNINSCLGYSVVGKVADKQKYIDNADFFVAIGNGKVRKDIIDEIEKLGGNIATLVHPTAVIAKEVKIGKGSVVVAGAIINPAVEIGKGVIINTCSSVDHDCKIGDYTHIAVGVHIAGAVKIEENCFLGAGTVMKNNISICSDCAFGAGAVVVKDISEKGTYVGVPVRKIK